MKVRLYFSVEAEFEPGIVSGTVAWMQGAASIGDAIVRNIQNTGWSGVNYTLGPVDVVHVKRLAEPAKIVEPHPSFEGEKA